MYFCCGKYYINRITCIWIAVGTRISHCSLFTDQLCFVSAMEFLVFKRSTWSSSNRDVTGSSIPEAEKILCNQIRTKFATRNIMLDNWCRKERLRATLIDNERILAHSTVWELTQWILLHSCTRGETAKNAAIICWFGNVWPKSWQINWLFNIAEVDSHHCLNFRILTKLFSSASVGCNE